MAGSPEKRVVTKDIAAALGVSVCTVNKALTGKPGVSEERRRQVQEKAREMGYVVDGVAQILRRNPMTIGVVPFDDRDERSTYHGGVHIGMKEELQHLQQYKVRPAVYVVTNKENTDDVEGFERWLQENEVEAVCIDTVAEIRRSAIFRYLAELQIPVFTTGEVGGVPVNLKGKVGSFFSMSGRLAGDFFYTCHGKDTRLLIAVETLQSMGMQRKSGECKRKLAERGVDTVEVLEHFDDADFLCKEIEKRILSDEPINCLYLTTGVTGPVCRFLKERQLQNRVTVLGTDYYKDIRELFECGALDAVFLQNEQKIGARTVQMAYDYLVNSRTFGKERWEKPREELIRPLLCLGSYFEDYDTMSNS